MYPRDARHGGLPPPRHRAIHYENHSPDTLRFVWVQIEQNIFSKTA